MALRYGAALAFSLLLFAALVEAQVERRVNRQAEFLLRLQLVDLVDDFDGHTRSEGGAHARAWLSGHAGLLASNADPQIGLGIELLDRDGQSLESFGSLVGHRLPLDHRLRGAELERSVRAANLGGRYAYLVATAPVEDGFLRVAVDTEQFADNVREIRRIFLVSIPIVLAISAFGGWFLSRGALKPIAEINRTARRISASNIDTRIPTSGSGDELDQLVGTLNDMIARIRDGMQRIERFSANAAHELRSPLHRIAQQIEGLLSDPTRSEAERQSFETMAESVAIMTREIEALLQLSRVEQGIPEGRRRRVDLGQTLSLVGEFFRPDAEARGLELSTIVADGCFVHGEETWLRQLASNLVGNAIKYTPAGGRVEIRAAREAGDVILEVTDSGPGVPIERRQGIFERFERGTDSGEPGFGLGLPIAREIVRAHGGTISVSDAPGGGSRFSVRLAAAD